jgi:hypothetical protein
MTQRKKILNKNWNERKKKLIIITVQYRFLFKFYTKNSTIINDKIFTLHKSIIQNNCAKTYTIIYEHQIRYRNLNISSFSTEFVPEMRIIGRSFLEPGLSRKAMDVLSNCSTLGKGDGCCITCRRLLRDPLCTARPLLSCWALPVEPLPDCSNSPIPKKIPTSLELLPSTSSVLC